MSPSDDAVVITTSSDSEEEEEFTVADVLAERRYDDGQKRYLVKWEGYGEERYFPFLAA